MEVTLERLAEIERLARAATPGDWHAWNRGAGWEIHRTNDPDRGEVDFPCLCGVEGCQYELPSGLRADLTERDALYIAAVDPPTVLAMAAIVRAVLEDKVNREHFLAEFEQAHRESGERDDLLV